jgi:pilus assembly protein CpaC
MRGSSHVRSVSASGLRSVSSGGLRSVSSGGLRSVSAGGLRSVFAGGLRLCLRRRGKQLVTSALCAASFLAGQLLLGEEPTATKQAAPQTVVNHFVQAPDGEGEALALEKRAEPKGSARARSLKSTAIQPIDNPTIKRPTSVGLIIDNPTIGQSLPQIIAPADAKPLAGQESAARSQEPEATSPGRKRVEAKPLELNAPFTPHHSPLTSSADDGLPPIVPASAMPKRPGKGTGARGQEPGVRSPEPGAKKAAKPWMEDIRTALGVTEGSTVTNPKSEIQNPKSLATPAQFTRDADDAALFAAQPAANNAAQPGANNAAQPAAPAISPLPAGSPFEAIGESGTVTVRVRRSLLMRTKVDIYRTAVVDESVCDIVQFTPREISLIGRAQGTTHITFWFDDPGTPPLTYLVKVEPDPAIIKNIEDKFQMLEDLVNEQFPDSKIKLVVLADKLLLKGQAKDAEEAAQILTIVRTQGAALGAYNGNAGWAGGVADSAATGVIPAAAAGALANQPTYQIVNMLRVPGVQQVALRVKIAELNRSAARGFGVNVKANIEFGDAVNGSKLLLASLLNANASGNTNLGGTSVIANISGDDASIGIRYLQSHGVIRLLSEPTLVTLSGRPATFVAGGEFAVPTVVGSVGLNAVTTDFRAFGAIISFLPTVIDKDRIRLQVAPEFSQINSQLTVGGTPGLNVRSATTTVEMREGQTLAIAGLLEDNYKATNVGDLPFLAKIFGHRDAARNETELIILVTPELVHPMEPEEVPPLPGFDVTEPTNGEFFLCGDIEGYPTREYRSTVWPRLRKRYGGPAMTSGPFGHGQ